MSIKTFRVIGVTPPAPEGQDPVGGILALYDPEQGDFDPQSSRVHLWNWPAVPFPLDKLEGAAPDTLPPAPQRTVHWQSALAHSVGYGPFPVETLTLTVEPKAR